MTYSTGLRGAACFAALVAGGAAQADVTAAQVWDDWKAQLSLYGEDSVTIGSEKSTGDTVTVRDLALNVDDGTTQTAVNMGDITFSELGDGTVRVVMADSYPIAVTGDDGVVVTILVSQSNMDMVVSGDADEMNYAISADHYTIELQDIVDGDITFTGDVSIVASDLSGSYTTSADELRYISYGLNIGALDLLADIEVPDADGQYVTASGKIEGMILEAEMTLPLDADFENPNDLFANGFAVSGGYTIDSGAYVFDVNAEGERVAGSVSTGAARLQGEMNRDMVAYEAETKNLAVNITTQALPLPVEVGLEKYGVGFEMPVGKTDEPRDFGLRLDFTGLTVSDMIWDMLDAAKVLPRDPATIQLDIAGTARPMFDLLDPAQAEALGRSDMPVELNTLTLNNIRIALAGALVTGQGAFTFDNTDMTTIEGMPRPQGDAIFEIIGVNALMDNLVSMGLLPQDQVMGGRMMLGMFARVTGDDQLETKLEVNGEGHVIVNGQRLR
ncbi:DUF2125 domain-containing protein [Yoonia sp.]|uniref:DUF2125 domain-containing protein n=1 Tax=Yoonia sp. TaxID=2212373 RepID=UPI0025E566F7|nr:DUF2125 domain-containing protein [Yoonia sp.]